MYSVCVQSIFSDLGLYNDCVIRLMQGVFGAEVVRIVGALTAMTETIATSAETQTKEDALLLVSLSR